jgi:hypothetical protein
MIPNHGCYRNNFSRKLKLVEKVRFELTKTQGPTVLQTATTLQLRRFSKWSRDTDSNRMFRIYEIQTVAATLDIGVDNGSRTRPGSFTESSASPLHYIHHRNSIKLLQVCQAIF